MSLDSGRDSVTDHRAGEAPARDVTAVTRDVTAPPLVVESEFPGLRRRLVEQQEQIETLERKLKLAQAPAERFRAWLVEITLSCQGKAVGLAQQAIYSSEWPGRARLPSTPSRPGEESNE